MTSPSAAQSMIFGGNFGEAVAAAARASAAHMRSENELHNES
jgi:hypothetical protein